MEHKGVGVLELKPLERGVDLRADRRIERVDLVDHEYLIANTLDRHADDLLGVAVLIAGCSVDQVQPSVDRAARGGQTLLQRQAAIGQVANAQRGGKDAGAAQRPPRLELLPTPHDVFASTTSTCSSGGSGGTFRISVSPRPFGSGTPRSSVAVCPAASVMAALPPVE